VQAFTHISPMFYSLNYNYKSGLPYYSNCNTVNSGTYNCKDAGTNSFGGLTTQNITQQLSNAGLLTVPGIYAGAGNGGTDQGIQNILDNVGNASTNFIAAMVQEAVKNGYAGYNLDWEVGSSPINHAYAAKFVSFVNAFKQALGPLLLSVDVMVSNIDGAPNSRACAFFAIISFQCPSSL
jgi:spore germination protein YaaH